MTTRAGDDILASLLNEAGWARRLAIGLLRDDAGADDVVQDAWTAALRRPPRADRPLGPWLATVVRNLAWNRIRGDRNRRAREAAAVDMQTVAQSVPTPEEQTQRMEAHRLLADVVAGLDEPAREVVFLRYYEGRSSAEIGRLLGVPAGTVRWRLKAGLDGLRGRLDASRGGRDKWLPMIAPLAVADPPKRAPASIPASGSSLGKAAAAALFVGMIVVGVVVLRRAAQAPTTGRPARSSEPNPTPPGIGGRAQPPEAYTSPVPRTGVLAAAPADASCLQERSLLRTEIATLEASPTEEPSQLFERGKPNPTAQAALSIIVKDILEANSGGTVQHALECRTRVCRLKVIEPSEATGGDTNRWVLPLQRDERMRALVTSTTFTLDAPTHDPISGAALKEFPVFFTLAPDPIAAASIQAAVRAEAPPTRESCRREVAALRERLADVRQGVDEAAPLHEQFRRGGENAALAIDVSRELRRARSDGADALLAGIECRARVCRFTAPEPASEASVVWARLAASDAWFRGRFDGIETTRGHGLFVRFHEPTTP